MVSKEGIFLKENGHYRATTNIDMDTNKIDNLPTPKEDSEAATKKYVDDIAKTPTVEEALIKENGGYNVVGGFLNMSHNEIRNLKSPENRDNAVTKGYVDDREIFTQFEDENPRLNEYLAGENSDVSVYEANGVLTTPYRLGLYQNEFKNEYDALNVKYVENLVANLNESLTTLNELYNRLKTKNEEVIEKLNSIFL